ncbi:MAG TPA: ABC transporter permease [Pirellulales bacterium]|nr:ABC transporter permease [Pirellulales bacterium]
MRPYLAIIKDSFREALASRVLWVLLVVTTLVLLALVPVSVDEVAATRLRPGEILNARALSKKIQDEQAAPPPSPGKQIWPLLSDELKRRLTEPEGGAAAGNWPGQDYMELSGELNDLLDESDLYDPAAWAGKTMDPQAERLLARGAERLAADDLARLNRLLLEAAYPKEIARSRAREVVMGYLWYRPFPSFPGKRKQIIDAMLTTVMNLFVGSVGIFAALLVTASIIPQTFEQGAIDLLLSKPISRSLLFFTKYLGGCMFTLINATYMIGGLWLISGLRLGAWNGRLWLCVPLLLFLFAIYYAVSALAGALWKNAIVAVVMSILFYFICLGVELTKGWTELFGLNPTRLARLVPAGETLFAANESGEVERWNEREAAWEPVLTSSDDLMGQPPRFVPRPPMVGPLYDPKHQRLYALPPTFPQFGLGGGGARLAVGRRKDGWKRVGGVSVPAGTSALLLTPRDELLAVAPRGLFQLEGDPTLEKKSVKAFGFDLPLDPTNAGFVPAGPEMSFRAPFSAAIDPVSGDVAVYDRKQVTILTREANGRYRRRLVQERESDDDAALAMADGKLLLAWADGRVEIYAGADLSPWREFQPEGKNPPRFAVASPDGRYFAVVFHHRRLWLYDARSGRPCDVGIAGQGNISAAAFSGDKLLVADRFTRVIEYELEPAGVARRFTPTRGVLENLYFYGIKPLYTVFPKPGELGNMVTYLLSGSESVPLSDDRGDLGAARLHLDVWGPLWSNLAFVAVVVGLGCWYTRRKDF